MKLRKLVAAAALLLSSTQLSAQDLNIGLKAGADLNQITGFSLNNEFKGYFFGGVQTQLRYGRLGIQLDGLLTQTSMTTGPNFSSAFREYVRTSAASITSTDILLTELGFPLAIDWRLSGPLRVEAGAQYSLIINAKDQNNYLWEPRDVIREGYLSGLLGLKLDVFSFQLGIRYIQGLENINVSNVPERWSAGRFQFSLSYLFF